MKNLRGVCAAGWGEPCPASAGCESASWRRARTEATHWGEENPLPNKKWERLIYPVFEPFPYLELALVALAEIPEADAEGVFPLGLTQ